MTLLVNHSTDTSSWQLRGLYAVTDPAHQGAQLINLVQAALAGGARIIQYRDKSTDSERRLHDALALQKLCLRFAACLIINDDPLLARQVNAAGVHLGKADISVAQARNLLGPGKIIGVSCYDSIAHADQLARQGAHYLAFGSAFPSSTKPDAATRAEPLLFTLAKCQLRLPIVGIGGITLKNAPVLLNSGCDIIAVTHGVFGQADVQTAARRLSELCTDLLKTPFR